MKTSTKLFCFASGLFALVSLAMAAPVYSDDPVDLAPPVATSSGDMVFNWNDIPDNQVVYLNRATFDPSGYTLYDTVGEQISVPFENNNLYVMKFAYTGIGRMYFVRRGDTPILYVPQDGYLENASVAGARWYPFPTDNYPQTPVYLGIAPSWNEYVALGWRGGMFIYGGYWCEVPFYDGCVISPLFDIDIVFGGEHFHGWDRYAGYNRLHPAPFYPGRGFSGPGPVRHPLGGSGLGRHPLAGSHSGAFAPHSGSFSGAPERQFRGIRSMTGSSSSSGVPSHTFGGGGSASGVPSHTFGGGSSSSGVPSHTFGGGSSASGVPSHTFGGGGSASGVPSHTFGGGSSSFSRSSAPSGGGFSGGSHESHSGASGGHDGFGHGH
jgi:hypothetical protein